MAAVTAPSQLRNLSLGDQHFNYRCPSEKLKKKDTLIYPSAWLDSCQSLVLVRRLAGVHCTADLLPEMATRRQLTAPDLCSPPAPDPQPTGRGVISTA